MVDKHKKENLVLSDFRVEVVTPVVNLFDLSFTDKPCVCFAGSIISKKGAESLSALILDVKFGKAALYKDLESAKKLAQSLVLNTLKNLV